MVLILILGVYILNSGCDKCGVCLDVFNDKMLSVYLDGRNFYYKFIMVILIVFWISLNWIKGCYFIF